MLLLCWTPCLLLATLSLVLATHPKCQPNPCSNAGKCYYDKAINDFGCLCPSRFTGRTCAQMDLCASHQCVNLGTCVEMVNTLSYRCDCLPGFTGTFCETVVSFCSSNPCVNGQCKDLGTDYRCQCNPGYTGRNCETAAGLCSAQQCSRTDPLATCNVEDVGYSCACSTDTFFGLNCESGAQDCHKQDESYCICEVDNLPVKFAMPTPQPYEGAETRDVLAGVMALLIGWLMGSALFGLYHCCCSDLSVGGAMVRGRSLSSKPWDRPSTGYSTQTTSTVRSVNQIQPEVTPNRNIYRAGFSDDINHVVSTRKSEHSYSSGLTDWH